MIGGAYRDVWANPPLRRLLAGIGVSALGDGLSMVTIAWLAIRLAPRGHLGLFVGVAVAAYTLPAAGGAVVLGGLARTRSARELVLIDCSLRASLLGGVAALAVSHALTPGVYLALLAGSSVMASWGSSGEYTLLAALAGPRRRLTANAASSAQASVAIILGPALAGVLLAHVSAGWLLAVDACSYVYLATQALRSPRDAARTSVTATGVDRGRGFAVLRRRGLSGLIAVTWVFFFLYGPVEDALPVYVARVGRGHPELLGAYWSAFGVGALLATLITGAIQVRRARLTMIVIIAGWGACLIPFAAAPVVVTLGCFAVGGVIYGPFIPITYSIFQALAPPADLPPILAARSAVTTIAAPLGTAVGGPLIGALGAAGTLAGSGAATVVLSVVAVVAWRAPEIDGPRGDEHSAT